MAGVNSFQRPLPAKEMNEMKIRRVHAHRKPAPLPLFLWADKIERAQLPLSARHILRRYNLSPSHARLVAELAGLQVEVHHDR